MTASPPASVPFDPLDFRKALGAFPTGVTVVTTVDAQGAPRGFTANSFTSVSLSPPLVLVCLAKAAHSHAVFSAAPGFVVNVLAEQQKAVASTFASKQPDKFERCAWQPGSTGLPLIEGAAARFECTLHQAVDAGDHTVLIGQVVALHHAADAHPLGYCRGAYVGFLDEQRLAAVATPATRVAGLIETPRGVLLQQDAEGRYALPSGARLGAAGDDLGLLGRLRHLGVRATLDFVFSVYEDANGPCVVYRGRADEPPQHLLGAACVPLDALAQLPVADEATASLLGRYARERRDDVFGVYVGDAREGDVLTVSSRAA